MKIQNPDDPATELQKKFHKTITGKELPDGLTKQQAVRRLAKALRGVKHGTIR